MLSIWYDQQITKRRKKEKVCVQYAS